MLCREVTEKTKVVYLVDKLAPYHVACFNEFANIVSLYCIEFASKDLVYKWDEVGDSLQFERSILFENKAVIENKPNEIRIRALSVLSNIKADIVVIGGWDSIVSLYVFKWCLKNKIPTVMASDSQFIDKKRNPILEFFKTRIVRNASAGFTAGMPHKSYLASLGIKESLITCGSSVVDNEHFEVISNEAKKNPLELRLKYSLPETYLLCSARFIPEKNLLNLVRAFSLFKQNPRFKEIKLIILGFGILNNEIVNLIKDLNLDNQIILPGHVSYDVMPIYYGLAYSFILPSISEPWGLVVNEAMASGLPVLVSKNCGCVQDLIVDGENGIIFDPQDLAQIANSLEMIFSNNDLRLHMAKMNPLKIRNWNLEKFSTSLKTACVYALSKQVNFVNIIDKISLSTILFIKELQLYIYSFSGKRRTKII